MNKIVDLASIYSEYKIFPLNTFQPNTPLRVFQRMFPDNYYSRDMNNFLSLHDYLSTRRGADLPWWGEKYFESDNVKRCMIVSQDSLSLDSGSVAFYAHIMQEVKDEKDYRKFYEKLDKEYQKFGYGNWSKIKRLILGWGFDFEKLFITDASKVYMEGSREKFDIKKSKELLEREINFCKPDILVLLGAKPLKLLSNEYLYSDIVDKAELLKIDGISTVVCPFPVGNGLTQKNFSERMNKASDIIKRL